MFVKYVLVVCMLFLGVIVAAQNEKVVVDTSQLEEWEGNMILELDKYRAKQNIVLPGEPDFEVEKTKVAYGFLLNDSLLRGGSLHAINLEKPSESKAIGIVGYLDVVSGALVNGKYYGQLYIASNINAPWAFLEIDLKTGHRRRICRYKHAMRPPLITGMAYDPVQEELLGVSIRDIRLFSIDTLTGDVKVVANLGRQFLTFAISEDGIMYGIDIDNNLCEVDRRGNVRKIGHTGVEAKGLQSMTFDPDNGKLYWAMESGDSKNAFYTVDLTTGKATLVEKMKYGEEWGGLCIPGRVQPGQLERVADLAFEANRNGLPEGMLTWKMPSSSSKITKVEVFRDGKLLASLKGNAQMYKDMNIPGGMHIYRVVAWNKAGKGKSALVQSFVGVDVPAAVTGVALTRDEKGNTVLQWNPVLKGRNGGAIDTSYVRYHVYRFPENKKVSETRATTLMDPTVNELAYYHYGVQVETNVGMSEMAYSNGMLAGNAMTVPYACKFTESEASIWTILDVNGCPGERWGAVLLGTERCMAHRNPADKNGKDELLLSPPILMKKERCYRLRFDARAPEAYPSMSVTFGNIPARDGQQEILKLDSLSSRLYRTYEVEIPAITATNLYYFGFQSYSETGEKIPPHLLYITNVYLYEVTDPVIAKKLEKAPAVDNDGASTIFVGYTIPDFSCQALDGSSFNLHDLKGKLKILDVWFSPEKTSEKNRQELVALYRDFHKKGLEIVSFACDLDKNELNVAIERSGMSWLQAGELKGLESSFMKSLYVRDVPCLLLLDENNRVLAFVKEAGKLRALIKALL